MKVTASSVIAVAMVAQLVPFAANANDIARKSHWRGAYYQGYTAYQRYTARIAPPVVTIVTPDLSYPAARYVTSRLDDSYDYPLGYGEYAVYGRWARDVYGRPDVTRCRLVWYDGLRVRSLNRCD